MLLAREAAIWTEYQMCKMMSAASSGGHWKAIESMVKLRIVINENICMESEFFWKPENTQNHISNIR